MAKTKMTNWQLARLVNEVDSGRDYRGLSKAQISKALAKRNAHIQVTLDEKMKTIDCGNNESFVRGATQQADGSWLALTSTDSKEFKTQEGAQKWLARRGYDLNGERLA